MILQSREASRACAALILFLSLVAFAAPADPAQPAVRIGYLNNDLHHLALWVALDKGFLKEEGLAVTVAGVFQAGPEEMTAFASRSLDMGYLGIAPALTGAANRASKIKVVALANTEGSAIVVKRDSPIRSVADLRGKTVAIPGYANVQDILLRKALDQAGLDAKQISLIVVKPPEMITALETGQIDAFIAWEPFPTRAVRRGTARVLLTSSRIWKGHPCCVVAVEADYLARNRNAVQAFLRAHRRATNWIAEHPADAAAVAVQYTGMDADTVRESMGHIAYQFAIPRQEIREYAGALLRYQYIKVSDPETLLDAFIDLSVLAEAMR